MKGPKSRGHSADHAKYNQWHCAIMVMAPHGQAVSSALKVLVKLNIASTADGRLRDQTRVEFLGA